MRSRWLETMLAVLACIVYALPAAGQDYPPTMPGATVETFKTVNDVDLKAWIFLPDGHQASDKRPAVVFFFGGGWVSGSPTHFERQAQALRSRGMVAILADYRVASRNDTKPASAVEDAKSAIRWVRQHAGDLGIDPNRIAAAGGSSGGHLAAATATLPGFDASGEDLSTSSAPNALFLFNPVVIVAPVEGMFPLNEALQERMAGPLLELSPFHHLRAGTPPTLIMHGTYDERVPVATVVAYCQRAVELGNECEVVEYDGAGHGFFNNSPYYEPTLQKMLQSLETLSWIEPIHEQGRTAAEYMAAIEGAQSSAGPNDLGTLTIAELMARFNVPGVSVAVIRDFQIHWAKGYGIADVETGAPVDTETMFQAASISKPVAAMAVLRAVQDGLFTLDTDINDILESWTLDGAEFTRDRPVTPRTLTSHTSGLGDGFGFPGYDPSGPIPTAVQILAGHELSNVGPLFMERPPMSLMEYSGGGVTLMQQAVSDARDRPFAEIMSDDVLTPIGMSNSSYEQPISPERDRNAARAHSDEGKAMGPKWHVYPEMAAAGLWTTPSDLARFAIEVQRSAVGQSNRVLSRTTVQEMLSPVGVGDYAVGFSISKIGQGWYFTHGGSNWGFRATLLAHKVKGYGLAIMTNADQGGAVAAELSRRIQMTYEWDSFAEPAPRGYRPPVERVEIDVDEEILEAYVGEYQLTPEISVSVTLEDGQLYVEPTGQSKLPLFAESADMFFMRAVNAQISFTRAPSGEVTTLVLHQGGRQQPAHKMK